MNIPAVNWSASIEGISIETDSLFVVEGLTYLFKNEKGYARAFYQGDAVYKKLDDDSGSLFIKKHDVIKRILSGTFSFTATRVSTGKKVNITEGRFDIRY